MLLDYASFEYFPKCLIHWVKCVLDFLNVAISYDKYIKYNCTMLRPSFGLEHVYNRIHSNWMVSVAPNTLIPTTNGSASHFSHS